MPRPWLPLALLLLASAAASKSNLRVGVGISDVTGPPAEVIFMGYANFHQQGAGIHLRQFSRAFVTETGLTRLAFVCVDAAMMGHGVRKEVIKRLKQRFGPTTYNESNVIISATHSHSTPGGFMMDFLFDLPITGFVGETFSALVSGIYKSIVIAHLNLKPARAYYGETEILDANINRSPGSYLLNPHAERARYSHDTDKRLSQVRFVSWVDKQLIGVINWYAVHPTSMNNTNCLISSDNVGYASILMEKKLNGKKVLPGKGSIVCAFASTNLGDVSPNTRGPRCEFSGEECDGQTELCRASERCIASGPGVDMFDSTRIIATKLFEGAMRIMASQGEDITGPVSSVHQYVDMPKQVVPTFDPVTETFNKSAKVHGCLPAMGYSFAAGTTDGPGAFNFTQGTTTPNRLWNAIRDFIAPPTPSDIECHAPKPILLATGRATFPYEWQPKIVSLSVARIGSLFIAAVPGEFTTMSGRRLRSVVNRASGGVAHHVVIAGLSNTYSDYVATPEEYKGQRYEGASTIYGPNTLNIYLNKYHELTEKLVKEERVCCSLNPPDFSNALISLVPPVLWDRTPSGHEFGDCVQQPEECYGYGDLVVAKFVSGHPRNNLRHGRWFAAVEKLVSAEDDGWVTVATDADWDTMYKWERDTFLSATSTSTVEWFIPEGTPPGVYRLHHYGSYKYILGGIYPYHGFTDSFEVAMP